MVTNYTTAQIEIISNHYTDKTYKKLSVEQSELIYKPLWWQLRGLMYTATGYGKKIPTDKMIKFNGRFLRIYCHIFSNCGTCYIVSKGEQIIID